MGDSWAVDVEQLVAEASYQAASDDFGEETWREGLEVLVRSLGKQAALNGIGEAAMKNQIVGNLVNRLRVEQCYREHPEIEDQEIVSPLFGLGLPRTGSTALSFLISRDPARRSLRVWEANDPCPPPESATEHTDARIATAQAGVDFTNEMFPGFAGMLPTAADGPQECLIPMAFDFRSLVFDGMSNVPGYTEWLLECDMVPAYRYHERVLKLLQWKCPPRRWWLKSPAHMLSIEALDSVYPDARFVMTHRDVGSVLPSLSALYDTLISTLTDRRDPAAIGRRTIRVWLTALRRLIEFRDAGNERRFHDLSFDAVQKDPIGQVEHLYRELGDDLSDEARKRMEQWWSDRASSRSAPRRYPVAEFGLDLDRIAADFSFYHERFGILPAA